VTVLQSFAAFIVLFAMSGCVSMEPHTFENTQPRFVVEEYFAGKTKAWGIFEDRFGNLRRQFVVDIDGQWDGDVLTLEEHFKYSDGETETRTWNIYKHNEHDYTGTAGGVVGKAVGQSYGNALQWQYVFNLKIGEKTLKVRFDDWMYLQSDGVLLNRAKVTKFGVELGTVTLAFSKNYKFDS
jgi:hypothetical protein